MDEKLDAIFSSLLEDEIEESIFFGVTVELRKNLQKLKPQFIVTNYRLDKLYLTIELESKNDSEWFMDIHLNQKSLEFVLKSIEFEIFFDSASLIIDYLNLIKAFFKGEYQVINYSKKGGQSLGNCIKWDDDLLSDYNQQFKHFSLVPNKIDINKKIRIGSELVY